MVRRPRHDAVVRRPLAQGGLRHLHGGQGAGRPRARGPTRGRRSTSATSRAAYAVDQTAGTRPLWQALDNLDQAKSNYGAIVYNKAPRVLKQLEYLVGESAFQRGRADRSSRRHAYGNATWQDLLGVDRQPPRGAHSTGLAATSCCAPGCRSSTNNWLYATATSRGSRSSSVPRRRSRETGHGRERTEVLLFYHDRPTVRVPVEVRARVTEVPAATGRPAPDFVFANARDYGYFLLLLDTHERTAPEDGGALGMVDDRSCARCSGERSGTRCARREWSQRASCGSRFGSCRARPTSRSCRCCWLGSTGRWRRISRPRRRGQRVQPEVERCYGKPGGRHDAARTASGRHTSTHSPAWRRRPPAWRSSKPSSPPIRWPVSRSRDPTRWDIVNRLLELGAPSAEARYCRAGAARHHRRRPAPRLHRGRRPGRAGRPSGSYFARYFADSTLNEDWAAGQSGRPSTPSSSRR